MNEIASARYSGSAPPLLPTVQDEVESLAHLINKTDNGLIAFALYNGAANRCLAQAALTERLRLPIVEIPLSGQETNPLPRLRDLPPAQRHCVFITRVEDALPEAAGTLNLQRESFAALPHAVIFWVTEYGLRQLATLAPDFCAWRSGVFDLRQEQAVRETTALQLILDASPSFQNRADLEKRISLYRDLLAEYEQQRPVDRRFLGDLHHRLAAALYLLGEYHEALGHARQALQLREEFYGPDHPEVASALHNLAGLLWANNRHTEAEPLYRRALQILLLFERRTGHEHPHYRTMKNNYTLLLKDMGLAPAEIEERLKAIVQEVPARNDR